MRSGKGHAFAYAALLIAASMWIIFHTVPANAQENFDCRLYLQPSYGLETLKPPSPGPGDPRNNLENMNVGVRKEYDLTYPVTDDFEIDGPLQSGNPTILLHLEDLFDPSSNVILSVMLMEEKSDGQEELLAADEVEQPDSDDMVLPISGDRIIEGGSVIKLILNVTQGTGPIGLDYILSFSYTLGDHSYLSFYCEPVPDVDLRMTNTDDNEIVQILPNGPPEARTVVFHCGAKSVFGAYDIESINLLMASPNGSVVINRTSAPDNSGGQEWTYFNFTEELQESLPVGTYGVTITGISHTGFSRSEGFQLEVVEGLYVSLIGSSDLEADAGGTVDVGVEVINGGGTTDRISFSASDTAGWSVQTPQSTDIGAGSTETVNFKISVPMRSRIGDSSTITMKVDSRNAGDTYPVTVTIAVVAEATFGIEAVSDTFKAINPGMSAEYILLVTNLRSEAKIFEIAAEGLHSSMNAVMDAPGGYEEGSYYNIGIGGGNSTDLSVEISTSSITPLGTHSIEIRARPRGEPETRSVFLSLLVVDPEKDVLSIPYGGDERTASRSGTVSPIKYNSVVFQMFLYNPTLEEIEFSVSVEAPSGWEYRSDYSSVELLPGTGSEFNVSVTPPEGQTWSDSGYYVIVTAKGGTLAPSSVTLTVNIPEIRGVELSVENAGGITEADEGDDLIFNFTVTNRGNRIEDVDIIVQGTDQEGISVSVDPDTMYGMQPGDEEKGIIAVKIEDISKDTLFILTVEANMGDYTDDAEIQIQASQVSEGMDLTPLFIGIGVLLIIGLIVVGLLLFSRYSSRKVKKPPEQEKEKPSVKITAERDERHREKPVRSPPDREVISEADEIAREILGESGGKDEAVTMEVEANVVE
jgi:uncharacterized membrane protein